MNNYEIKFRAFDKRIKTMYPFCVLGWNGSIEARLIPNDAYSIADITTNHANGTFKDYDGEVEVMQYIGVKDVEGKEIFVGDIVTDTRYYHPMQVIYEKERCCFSVWGVKFYPAIAISHRIQIEQWKVIGNIFESPELLEKSS